MKIKIVLSRIINFIKSIFLTGLFTLLPLTITLGILNFSFNLIKDWLQPIRSIEPYWMQEIPHSEVIIAIIIILLLGAILKILIFHSVITLFEALLSKIPLLRQVYFGTKELINTFTPQETDGLKKVVLIEFPRQGLYSIGFLTSLVHNNISPDQSKIYYNIFIPATPNPTSGFLVAAQEKEFIIIDLTRQEAMSLIISGGIIKPERFKKQN